MAASSKPIHVVLAVGHSARPTFEMLHARGVHIEAKPFSIGVRIEHPQSWVDQGALWQLCGPPGSGRGGVQPRPPLRQWPHSVQLLHVPRRARGRRDIGGRARRHQWHEPI
jgi:hypothetical protein